MISISLKLPIVLVSVFPKTFFVFPSFSADLILVTGGCRWQLSGGSATSGRLWRCSCTLCCGRGGWHRPQGPIPTGTPPSPLDSN